MNTPQEVQVWHILPALRKEFALTLKKEGLSQKNIAAIMGLTEPAVSQYIKNKRGDSVIFSRQIKLEIRSSANKIANKETDFMFETQKLLRKIKDSKLMCEICHDHLDTDDNCKVCYI